MKVKDEDLAAMLDEAVELMNSKGAHWTQGTYVKQIGGGEHAYCSVGAIRQIAAMRFPGVKKQYEMRELLVEKLAEELPPGYDGSEGPENKVISWNDDHQTTWAKVRYRFRAAAKKLRDKT